MNGLDGIIEKFRDVIKRSAPKTSAYDTQATVTRVEGDTAWVHIPGGVDETPVKLTIAASKGDTVQVRVGGGKAWITGNATAPPTDDKAAHKAVTLASTSMKFAKSVVDRADAGEFNGKDGHDGQDGQDGQDGHDGQDGNEVTAVYPQYNFSTSQSTFTQAQGYEWTDTIPTYVSGLYYWTRTVTEYATGSPTYSTAIFDQTAQAAAEGEALANETNAHFWHDNNGAHVGQVDGDYSSASSGFSTTLGPSGETTRYNGNIIRQQTASANTYYDTSGNKMAQYGSSEQAFFSGNKKRASVSSNGLSAYDTDGSTEIARFGATARIGTASGKHINYGAGYLQFYKGADSLVNDVGRMEYGLDFNDEPYISLDGPYGTYSMILYMQDGLIGLTDMDGYINGNPPVFSVGKNANGTFISGIPTIDAGRKSSISVSGNDHVSGTISFNMTFPSAPIVVVGFQISPGGSNPQTFGGMACSAHSITTAGFTYHISNNSGTSRTPDLNWIAIGT